MPRYAKLIADGMLNRGYDVTILTAKPYFYRLPLPLTFKKWMGYVDQYLIFPIQFRLRKKNNNELYVFVDHALGPWVPLVSNLPHIIHCHDFLAQISAEGELRENKTGVTGKYYQRFIRKGYIKGNYFISISKNTQKDLHRFLKRTPLISEVIYNGLNQDFNLGNTNLLRSELSEKFGADLTKGFILHVGGNQFYKNRLGVLELFDAFTTRREKSIPIILIGAAPNESLVNKKEKMAHRELVYFIQDAPDEVVKKAYQAATVLLYPSLAEGFGWPIAEAQASGCPVITTNAAPMSEVSGDAALLIPKKTKFNFNDFIEEGVGALETAINWSKEERQKNIEKGIINSQRFDKNFALDEIERVYKKVFILDQSIHKSLYSNQGTF